MVRKDRVSEKYRKRKLTKKNWRSVLQTTWGDSDSFELIETGESIYISLPHSSLLIVFSAVGSGIYFNAPASVLSFEYAQQIMARVAVLTEPRYGFSRIIDSEIATNYVLGLISSRITSSADYKQTRSIWMIIRGFDSVRQSQIVDLFDLNLLSEAHVARSIQGKPLLEWIQRNNFGYANVINEISVVWSVDEKKMDDIRSVLLQEGFIMESP